MTAAKYATQEVKAGRFPAMPIAAGEFGTFWLHDADYRSLEGGCFTSREAAELARSKAIAKASKYIQ